MSNTKRMPYISNCPNLDRWLKDRYATCLWQTTADQRPVREGSTMVEGWLVRGVLVVVIVYGNGGGWDIFTPGPSGGVKATLADADKRISNLE